jgi:hypothetical protein
MDLVALRDVALLWLITLTFVAVAPWAVVFFFAVKGLHRLRQVTKKYLSLAQDKARQGASLADQASHKIAAPVITIQARAAQVDGLRQAIWRRNKP